MGQVETERKGRRRRRRRTRKSSSDDHDHDDDHHSVDDGTCSTASLSSASDSSATPAARSNTHRNNKQKQLKQQSSKTQRQQQQRQKKQQSDRPRGDGDDEELSPEEQRRHVALDCEMVGVGPHGHRSSVAKVTLVAMDGTVLLDEFVRQGQEVTDYRTYVSGVTERDLEAAPWDLEECRARVVDLLRGRVLVGHALKNDLRALGVSHPWHLTRDTAKHEPFMQTRFDDGVLWPRKLRDLARERLGRDIQTPGVPHSAYEDAMAAMDLYRTVRRKWEKIMDYKIQRTREIEYTTNSGDKQQ